MFEIVICRFRLIGHKERKIEQGKRAQKKCWSLDSTSAGLRLTEEWAKIPQATCLRSKMCYYYPLQKGVFSISCFLRHRLAVKEGQGCKLEATAQEEPSL